MQAMVFGLECGHCLCSTKRLPWPSNTEITFLLLPSMTLETRMPVVFCRETFFVSLTPDLAFTTSHVRRPFVVPCGIALSCNRAPDSSAQHTLLSKAFFILR